MHFMLDLETWSIRPNAAIAEIAIVPFELRARGRIYQEHTFHRYVMVQDGVGVMDNGTLAWWMSQEPKARKRLANGLETKSVTCQEMLVDLVTWPNELLHGLSWGDVEGLWSHGAAFDIPVLENAFNQHGIAKPWSYKIAFCTRTVARMMPLKHPVNLDPTLVEHYAPDDCIRQIMHLQAVCD